MYLGFHIISNILSNILYNIDYIKYRILLCIVYCINKTSILEFLILEFSKVSSVIIFNNIK